MMLIYFQGSGIRLEVGLKLNCTRSYGNSELLNGTYGSPRVASADSDWFRATRWCAGVNKVMYIKKVVIPKKKILPKETRPGKWGLIGSTRMVD